MGFLNVPTRAPLCILLPSAQTRQQQTKMLHGKPTTPSIMANSKKERWLPRLLEELQQHQDTRVKRARPLGVSRTTPKLGRSTTRKWALVSDSALAHSCRVVTLTGCSHKWILSSSGTNDCTPPVVNISCFSSPQPNQPEVQQLLLSQPSPRLELRLEASRTTAPPGLSTTDSRRPTTDKAGRHLDRFLLHSRVSR